MKCLINGCNFLIRNVPNEVFTIDFNSSRHEFKVIENENLFPYLLVNIGKKRYYVIRIEYTVKLSLNYDLTLKFNSNVYFIKN